MIRFTLAGYVDIKVNEDNEGVEVIATKPDWEVGASQALKKKTTTESTKKVWTLAVDDITEDDIESEDNLLLEEDLKKPTKSIFTRHRFH